MEIESVAGGFGGWIWLVGLMVGLGLTAGLDLSWLVDCLTVN
jgi:hypothetical protein